MTTSFPFLAIARRFDVPYSAVVKVASMHANYARLYPQTEWRAIRPDAEPPDVQTAIHQAFVAERARRHAIYAAAGS